MQDDAFMCRALQLARKAETLGEVPVGAVVVANGKIIGEGFNQPIGALDPSAHAEIVALRDAATRLTNYRLPNTTVYVTLEPCLMCFGALTHARIARLVYGSDDPKSGVISAHGFKVSELTLNHRFEIESGLLANESSALIRAFFKARR